MVKSRNGVVTVLDRFHSFFETVFEENQVASKGSFSDHSEVMVEDFCMGSFWNHSGSVF